MLTVGYIYKYNYDIANYQ